MKLCDLLQKFCEEHDNYKYCSAVDKAVCNDVDCIGIVVSKDNSCVKMMMELTEFLTKEEFDDPNYELEETSLGSYGADAIVYFPYAKA